jgi:serine/threonine protein kinase/WD40 repeat protein
MNADPMAVQNLFAQAVAIADPNQRQAFIREQCANDAELLRRVEVLLAAYDEPKPFFDQPTAQLAVLPASAPLQPSDAGQRPGSVVAGRYKLLEAIGEGGMGTVWVAEQTSPVRRKVALKLVKPGMDSRQVLARFDAERQALALMDHPNIAKVFDGGVTEQGRPFFAMEYVKGMPLTEYCDQTRLSLEERLKLFIPICQAVQHAHQKGIIHRDLKPSNVLICLYDGKPVPKVIDFGLAKAMYQPLTEHTLHTGHGLMIGTPLYMSPEQAEHNNLDVDTRTDIYSLGVMLYELLTGTTPLERAQFKEAAFGEILRLIKEVEPPKPSTRVSTNAQRASIAAQRSLEPEQLGRSIRGDLDWIVMKALDKERDRRYESANGLARDLERFLNQEAVDACPPSTVYRLRKQFQKHRAVISTAAAFLLLLCAGAVVSTWQAIRATKAEQIAVTAEATAREQRDKAIENERQAIAAKTAEANARLAEEQARRQADDNARTVLQHQQDAIVARNQETATRLETERRVVRLCLSTGAKFNELKDTDSALLWYSKAWQFDPDEKADEASHKLRMGLTLQQKPPIVGFAAHDDELKTACVDDQGQRAIALTESGRAHLWELRQARQIAQFDAGQPVICLALNQAGTRAITGEESGRVHAWDATTGKLLHTVNHGAKLGALAWKPDGWIFATAGGDAGVRFWDAETGKAEPVKVDVTGVYSLSFDSAGARFVTASLDGNARVWDAETGEPLTAPLVNSPPNEEERARFIRQGPVLSPDGQTVLVSVGSGVTHIDIDFGRTLWKSNVGYRHQCFSQDGSKLLLSGPSRTCSFVDSASGDVLKTFTTPRECRHSVFIDQNQIATTSSSGLIQLEEIEVSDWKFESRLLQTAYRNHSLKMLPDQRHFFVASKDGTMRLYDFKSEYSVPSAFGSGRANNMHFGFGNYFNTTSPDGNFVCAVSIDQQAIVRTRDETAAKRIADVSADKPMPIQIDMRALSARFSNSGEILGLVGPTSVRIWDPQTGAALGPEIPRPNLCQVAYSGDVRRVAFSTGWGQNATFNTTERCEVRVFDTHSGNLIFELSYPVPEEKDNNQATLNEDGTVLVTSDFSHYATVEIFDVDRGVKLSTIPAKGGTLTQLVLTEDGSRLLTVSSNTLARLWDCRTGEPVGPALKHPTFARRGAIAADGNRVATLDTNQIVYLWDGTRGDLFGRWGLATPPSANRNLWFSRDNNSIHFPRSGRYQSVGLQPWKGDLSIVNHYVAIVTGKALDFQSGSIDLVPTDTFTSRPEEFVRAFRISQELRTD